jgi:leucyl/phenylalanyl-tRNA--protein transferase
MNVDHPWPAPNPRDQWGLVALDFDLNPDRVASAYRHGIFPWPESTADHPIPWVCPPRRAILDFADLHVPKSLRKLHQKSTHLRRTVDTSFDAVIAACAAAPRRGQAGTWIIPPMVAAYTELHRRGVVHSVELWDGNDLVAGLYGVAVAGVFCGESMFTRIDGGSKLCVLHLIEHLRARGATWIDLQQLTPHFAILGAREISRAAFLQRLAAARAAALPLFP